MDIDIVNVLELLQLDLAGTQMDQLQRYMEWLATEATVGGAVGPGEHAKLANRHIADSLLYLQAPFQPRSILDLGSGAGLPGMVLAIAKPDIPVTLADRSTKRVGLMRRAARIVGVQNVDVVEADIDRDDGSSGDLVTMRAVYPPPKALPVLLRHCRTGAVLGLSRREEPHGVDALRGIANDAGFTLELKKSEVLEPASWMLIMARI